MVRFVLFQVSDGDWRSSRRRNSPQAGACFRKQNGAVGTPTPTEPSGGRIEFANRLRWATRRCNLHQPLAGKETDPLAIRGKERIDCTVGTRNTPALELVESAQIQMI